jgi:antitoxin ParD1/3/4
MAVVEKISIALPPEMAAIVRRAVETGEYASNSEVVREALREWTYQRELRQRGLDELRRLRNEAVTDQRPSMPAEEVLARLRAKYQTLENESGR